MAQVFPFSLVTAESTSRRGVGKARAVQDEEQKGERRCGEGFLPQNLQRTAAQRARQLELGLCIRPRGEGGGRGCRRDRAGSSELRSLISFYTCPRQPGLERLVKEASPRHISASGRVHVPDFWVALS